MSPVIFVHFNIGIFRQLFHFNFKGEFIQRVSKWRLSIHNAIINQNVLEMELETHYAKTDG